jgi:hypothetical protein
MAEMRFSNGSAPWLETIIPTRVRLMGCVGIAISFGLVVISIPILIVSVVRILLVGTVVLKFKFVVINIVLPILGLLFGTYGWVRVRHDAFSREDFSPGSSISPTELGQPIEVIIFRPIAGFGTIQFNIDFIDFRGERKPPRSGQLNLIAELIFDVVLSFLFRRTISVEFEYDEISNIALEGRKASIAYHDDKTQEVRFMVSSHDGERLYRELKEHYPSAISEWSHMLI